MSDPSGSIIAHLCSLQVKIKIKDQDKVFIEPQPELKAKKGEEKDMLTEDMSLFTYVNN